ncbi:MAG: hypothetical protein ACI4W6_00675, partial [Acutalibacteraceae bacterium]
SDTAKNYLLSAGSTGDTPFERLQKLNPQSVAFFKSRGIDLSSEPLEIAVCAQHINGGADVDIHWQTSVKNLFAIGEAAGTFGLYRPDGSALNSAQVGALRAAEYISHNDASFIGESSIENALQKEKEYISRCLKSANMQTDFSADMSLYAAESRNLDEIARLKDQLQKQCELNDFNLCDENYLSVLKLYRYKDTLKTQLLLCRVFCDILPKTGNRGGAICTQNGVEIKENEFYRNFTVVTEKGNCDFVPVRELPETEYSFEKEWNRFNEERGISLG